MLVLHQGPTLCINLDDCASFQWPVLRRLRKLSPKLVDVACVTTAWWRARWVLLGKRRTNFAEQFCSIGPCQCLLSINKHRWNAFHAAADLVLERCKQQPLSVRRGILTLESAFKNFTVIQLQRGSAIRANVWAHCAGTGSAPILEVAVNKRCHCERIPRNVQSTECLTLQATLLPATVLADRKNSSSSSSSLVRVRLKTCRYTAARCLFEVHNSLDSLLRKDMLQRRTCTCARPSRGHKIIFKKDRRCSQRYSKPNEHLSQGVCMTTLRKEWRRIEGIPNSWPQYQVY